MTPFAFIQVWRFFLLASLFCFFLALEIFGGGFAKLGIPLVIPESMGTIPHFTVKLFPMEMLLIFLGISAGILYKRWDKPANRVLFFLSIFLLVFGLTRALADLPQSPLLIVRNSAFVWYLSFSLLLAVLPVSVDLYCKVLQFTLGLLFVYFSYKNVEYLCSSGLPTADKTVPSWFADIGMAYALAYALYGRSRGLSWMVICSIGLAVAFGILTKIQRTALLGIFAFFISLPLLYRWRLIPEAFPWTRLVGLILSIPVSLAIVLFAFFLHEGDLKKIVEFTKNISPMNRYEAVGSITKLDGTIKEVPDEVLSGDSDQPPPFPIETFRWFLWQDAWAQYQTSPMWGVGFVTPVVTRVYRGNGVFLPNSGNFEKHSGEEFVDKEASPPIAGPHNSYLNALARLGPVGLGFLLLHLLACWHLVRAQLWVAALAMKAQILYALFNVGLEGPIHCFPLLICLAIAIKQTPKSE